MVNRKELPQNVTRHSVNNVIINTLYCLHWFEIIIQNHNQGIRVMVFNVTFNNISAILWQSVLLVEETRVPEENHRPAASH